MQPVGSNSKNNNLTHRDIGFKCVEGMQKKKLVSLHIAMFVNASETPFVSFQSLCFYVLKTFIPMGL